MKYNKLYDIRYKDGWREPNDVTMKQIRLVINSLRLKKNSRILDLGCGYGRHSLELAKQGYSNIVAIDRSKYLISKANKIAKEKKVKVNFQCGDMTDLHFHASFDAVIMMDITFGILSHSDNKKTLMEVSRALAPKGKLFLELFNKSSIEKLVGQTWYQLNNKKILLKNVLDRRRSIIEFYGTSIAKNKTYEYPVQRIKVYSYDQLKKMLKKAGLKIIAVYGDSCIPQLKKNPYLENSPNMVVIAQKE